MKKYIRPIIFSIILFSLSYEINLKDYLIDDNKEVEVTKSNFSKITSANESLAKELPIGGVGYYTCGTVYRLCAYAEIDGKRYYFWHTQF
jgi:hypothetical protein